MTSILIRRGRDIDTEQRRPCEYTQAQTDVMNLEAKNTRLLTTTNSQERGIGQFLSQSLQKE